MNLLFSQELIEKRYSKVEREICEFIQNEDYIQSTKIPKERIAEIKAAVGLTEQEKASEYDRYVFLDASIFVKGPTNETLEVEQLTLVEYREKKIANERTMIMELTCEGKTEEFMYDRVYNSPISLKTVAKRILESTGRHFVNEGDSFVIQTDYPSLKNLLEDYLVKGGWIPPEEAEKIDVIGYPSKSSNLEEVFGMETPSRKKPPSFRPRRRR